jgi:hypothetical protein
VTLLPKTIQLLLLLLLLLFWLDGCAETLFSTYTAAATFEPFDVLPLPGTSPDH